MSVLRQIASVTAMNMRSVPQRIGSSSVIVVGIAVVVGVLLSVFALTRSLSGAVLATGSPDRAIVLRAGATGEFSSTLLVDAVATIKDAPGIARTDDGKPAAFARLAQSAGNRPWNCAFRRRRTRWARVRRIRPSPR